MSVGLKKGPVNSAIVAPYSTTIQPEILAVIKVGDLAQKDIFNTIGGRLYLAIILWYVGVA